MVSTILVASLLLTYLVLPVGIQIFLFILSKPEEEFEKNLDKADTAIKEHYLLNIFASLNAF